MRLQTRHLKSQFCKLFLCTLATISITPTLAFAPHSYHSRHPSTTTYHPRHMVSTSSSSDNLTKGLSPRVLETLDPCVVLMKQLIGRYSHLWDDKGGIFSLAQGVVYWEPPSTCQEALIQEINDPNNLLHTYGPAQGIPELTDMLKDKIATENGLTNHDVMVTVGANQAYVNVVLTTLCGDSKAVVFAPYYFNHVMALQMCCGNDSVVVGPCNLEGIPDLEWLHATLKTQSIDMVTIVNPGNPTGVSLGKQFLQQVVDLCAEYNCWLVLDCAYEYFTVAKEDQPIATFHDAPHVIHIFSLSKSYSLAGYRCGYLCLHKDNATVLKNNMLKVQDTLPICPPRISQIAACGALKAGKDWVRAKYATLDHSRQLILDALQPLKIMGGSGAMYVMAQLPTSTQNETVMDDVEVCRRLVEEYGIAIIPGSFCGFPGWIRVCYANLEPIKCAQAADRLRNGIEKMIKMIV